MFMQRRVILKFTLTLVLLLGIFFNTGFTARASGEVTVQVKDVSASAGQTVTTELIMEGTFASFQGELIYDTDALTLENIEATSLVSGSITMFNQDEVTSKFINGSFVSASASNAVINGAVLTFTFSAGSNANGSYSFSIEQFLVYDEDGQQLTVNAVDTSVVPVTTYSTNNQEPTPTTTTQESTQSPTTNDQEASIDPNETDNPEASTDSDDPDDTEANTDINNSEANTDPTDTEANTDTNNSESNNSDGNGLVIPLLIIAVVVAVGIVLIVVRVKKKNKTKDI